MAEPEANAQVADSIETVEEFTGEGIVEGTKEFDAGFAAACGDIDDGVIVVEKVGEQVVVAGDIGFGRCVLRIGRVTRAQVCTGRRRTAVLHDDTPRARMVDERPEKCTLFVRQVKARA